MQEVLKNNLTILNNRPIILFDIDWTLVNGINYTHSDSFKYIFDRVFGLKNINVYDIRPHGMTDLQIISEILKINNLSSEFTKSNSDLAISLMGEYYIKNSEKEFVTLMPGVINLLNTLKKYEYLMGILSGNIEKVGKQKVAAVNISHYFCFGAFGDMSVSRADLVDFAEKDMQKNGFNATKKQFIIIGDSVRDIECAKKSKLSSIGVATGSSSLENLKIAGADLVVCSLEDIDIIMELITTLDK